MTKLGNDEVCVSHIQCASGLCGYIQPGNWNIPVNEDTKSVCVDPKTHLQNSEEEEEEEEET